MIDEVREAIEEQRRRLIAGEDAEHYGLLMDNEREVLKWRLGLGVNRLSLREVGELLGITKQRVGQIEKEALRKITRRRRQLARSPVSSAVSERLAPVAAVAVQE